MFGVSTRYLHTCHRLWSLWRRQRSPSQRTLDAKGAGWCMTKLRCRDTHQVGAWFGISMITTEIYSNTFFKILARLDLLGKTSSTTSWKPVSASFWRSLSKFSNDSKWWLIYWFGAQPESHHNLKWPQPGGHRGEPSDCYLYHPVPHADPEPSISRWFP